MIKLFETDPDPDNWNLDFLREAIGGFHRGQLIAICGPVGSGISFVVKELFQIPTNRRRYKSFIGNVPYEYMADFSLNNWRYQSDLLRIVTKSYMTMHERFVATTILETEYNRPEEKISLKVTKNRFGPVGNILNMKRFVGH